MRKITAFSFIILIVSLISFSVSATSFDTSLSREMLSTEIHTESVSFSESQMLYDIKLELLSLGGYTVFTKNMSSGELDLINSPYSSEEVDSMLDSLEASLFAVALKNEAELLVIIQDNPSNDFFSMDDSMLNLLGKLRVRQYENEYGAVVTDWSIFRTQTDAFIKVSSHSVDNSMYVVEYTTAINKKEVTICMYYYDIADSQTCEQEISSIINNVQLVNNEESSFTSQFAKRFFTDTNTGLVCMIPEGWSIISEEGAQNAFFVPDDYDATKMIMYSGYDMWEELINSDPNAVERSDYNSDGLTKKEAAELLNVDVGTVSIERLGSREFICIHNKPNPGDLGIYGYDFVQYVRIEDARMFSFLFTRNESDKDFLAFQEMVKEAFYP